MTTVAEILKSKTSSMVYAIAPTATVYEALRLMADQGIGSLLVKEADVIVGIFTERDYARKIALLGRTSAQTQVHDVMTTSVLCVHPVQTSEECMQLMTSKRLRHLPVMDNDQVVGIVSIGDLVKDIISEQKFLIEQLEHYISGGAR